MWSGAWLWFGFMSLMANETAYLSMYSLANFKKCLLKYCPFLNCIVFFFFLILSSYILLPVMWFSYIFSSFGVLSPVCLLSQWRSLKHSFLFLVWSSLLYLFASGCARLHCGAGFPLAVACRGLLSSLLLSLCGLLLWGTESQTRRLQEFGPVALRSWLPGSRARAQKLRCVGLVALWHVGSSWPRDQTHVPCIGRQTP